MLFLREVLLGISQNSQENTCARVPLKKRLWPRCFPVNFAKFLRTFFFYRTPPGDCFCAKYIALNILHFTQKQNCHENFSSITMIFSYIFFVFLFYFFGYLAKFDIYPCEVTNSCITKCNTSLAYMRLAKIIVEGHSIIT